MVQAGPLLSTSTFMKGVSAFIYKGQWIYFSLAALLGILLAMDNDPLFLILFVGFFLWLLGLRKLPKKLMFIPVIIFLLFFIRGEFVEKRNQTVLNGNETTFTVILQQPIKIDGNSFSAYAKDQKSGEKLLLQYMISSLEEKKKLERLAPGFKCAVSGELERPMPASNPNSFDYQEYLRHKGIFWKLTTIQLKPDYSVKPSGPIVFIQYLRQRGTSNIYDHFPEEMAPLAAALVFGDRSTMDPDLLEAYEKLGIVHLLAISGLHVGMLAGILFYVLLRLQISREKATNILIVFLPFYSVLTGASPSVIRACAMMLVVLLFAKYSRQLKIAPIDTICIVFFLYIFIVPNVIYDVGFQLSFFVTFSLLLSSLLLAKLRFKPLALLICTSFIAQLSSAPIMLYHFYEFSLLGIVANMVYVPLFSIIILPFLLVVFLLYLLLGSFMDPILFLLNHIVSMINWFTKLLSQFPFAVITLGRPLPVFLFLYFITIPFTLFCFEKAKTIGRTAVFLLIPATIMVLHYGSNHYGAKGEVTMIDVGQGDSIFIKLPNNKGTYLIDTGGNLQYETAEWKKRRNLFDTGENIVVPFLKSKGITKLDKLILTHGDIDHVGGVKAILQSVIVKEVVLPKSHEPSELEENIIKLCKEKKISIRYAFRGDGWSTTEARFFVLAPLSDNMSRNNQSIVIYAHLGGLNWLFTGDLETKGEALLMAYYPNLAADVLKVGHHGSNTSTSDEFLDFLQPKTALISAGVNNRFGHPQDEVLRRLQERDMQIYRTDRDGGISYYFSKEGGTFFTQLHRIVNKNE